MDIDEQLTALRTVVVVGTGTSLSVLDNAEYLNTFIQGPFVWHAFEMLS